MVPQIGHKKFSVPNLFTLATDGDGLEQLKHVPNKMERRKISIATKLIISENSMDFIAALHKLLSDSVELKESCVGF
jgi:hypothetical protein